MLFVVFFLKPPLIKCCWFRPIGMCSFLFWKCPPPNRILLGDRGYCEEGHKKITADMILQRYGSNQFLMSLLSLPQWENHSVMPLNEYLKNHPDEKAEDLPLTTMVVGGTYMVGVLARLPPGLSMVKRPLPSGKTILRALIATNVPSDQSLLQGMSPADEGFGMIVKTLETASANSSIVAFGNKNSSPAKTKQEARLEDLVLSVRPALQSFGDECWQNFKESQLAECTDIFHPPRRTFDIGRERCGERMRNA